MNANILLKKIEMTKAEAKAAGKVGTHEYNELVELMNRFLGFTIEIKNTAKKVNRFRGLDCEYMERYIKDHKEELLKTFYKLRGLDENGKKVGMAASATFGEIKMWFLNEFPEIEGFADNVNKIIEDARKARASKKHAA
jgi:hypothetical protein